jgi:hypothetical protein
VGHIRCCGSGGVGNHFIIDRVIPNPCRSWLASEGLKDATFLLLKRVIVNVLRWQASSYREFGVRTLFTTQQAER